MSLITEEKFIAEMARQKVCKAVWGDYVLYDRKYLATHLEQENKLIKSWYDYKQKRETGEIANPADVIRKYKEDLGLKDE